MFLLESFRNKFMVSIKKRQPVSQQTDSEIYRTTQFRVIIYAAKL